MSDGDRFDALGAVDEPDDEIESDDADSDDSTADPEPKPEPMTETEPETTTDTTDETTDESIDDPAFSYNESNQGPIYARPETWDTYDDLLELDVERYLRDQGVRNAQKRELHDAALRLAAKHPEELGDLLIEARRES